MSNIVLTTEHITSKKNSELTYKFPRSVTFDEGNQIAVSNMMLYYSWFNISAANQNNFFQYTWWDENGNLISFKFIHSSSSKGPQESTYNVGGSRYYDDDDLYTGYYAWDTEDTAPRWNDPLNIINSLWDDILATNIQQPDATLVEVRNIRSQIELFVLSTKGIKNVIE